MLRCPGFYARYLFRVASRLSSGRCSARILNHRRCNLRSSLPPLEVGGKDALYTGSSASRTWLRIVKMGIAPELRDVSFCSASARGFQFSQRAMEGATFCCRHCSQAFDLVIVACIAAITVQWMAQQRNMTTRMCVRGDNLGASSQGIGELRDEKHRHKTSHTLRSELFTSLGILQCLRERSGGLG